MEIINVKTEFLKIADSVIARSSDNIRTTKQSQAFIFSLVLCLILCVSVSIAYTDNFEPLDLLDSNIPDINDIKAASKDFVDIAQANLVAKMDNSTGLQEELQNLIGQISSMQFKSKPAEQPAPDKAQTENTQQENPQVSQVIVPNAQIAQEDGLPNLKITDQTLSKLDQTMQKPQEVKNPLELANILYNCGKLKEAAVFYNYAYEAGDNNNVLYQDKAWILFQAGNCLQKDNPEAAGKIYKKIIVEYPDSFWAEPAKAKDHLVDWYIQQKPNTLLKRH